MVDINWETVTNAKLRNNEINKMEKILTHKNIKEVMRTNFKEENEVPIYKILEWHFDNDTVILEKDNKEITAKIVHPYQDDTNHISFTPRGQLIEKDGENTAAIKPSNNLHGVVLKCNYETYKYLLIGTLNFGFNTSAEMGELKLSMGESEILLTDNLISINSPNILLNGKPDLLEDMSKEIKNTNDVLKSMDERIKKLEEKG